MKRLASSLLAALLLATACSANDAGGEDLPTSVAPTATPAPFLAPGTTLVPETVQSALVPIREAGAMRVGVLYSNPPFSRLTEEGDLVGFEVDLVRAIAQAWGVEVSFVQVTRQTGIPSLLRGDVDLLAATVPHRRETHELVDFSQTIFRSGYLLLAPDDSPVEGIADLDFQPVAIVEDASFDVLGERARAEGVTPTAQQFSTTDEAVEALLEGSVAAVVGRREALMRATQSHPELAIREEFLLLEPYAFALRRDDANFRNLIDVSLQALVEEGTYAELFTQHFYGYPADEPVVWPGQSPPTFTSQSSQVDVPAESRVGRVARGETLVVAGLGSSYDDPELDGQRLLDDFNRALVNEFARRWGVSFDELAESGAAGEALVAGGQADLVFGVAPSRDFASGVDYTPPYLQRGLRLVRHADAEVEGIDDLDSHPVAVIGTPQDADLITSQNTNVELLDVTSARHALSLLQSQAASVVLADEFTAGLMARQDPTLVVMEEVYRPVTYAVAVPRYDSDFRALVSFTLQDMSVDGTLARLVQQYFGPYAPPEAPFRPFPVEVWPGRADYLGLPE